MTAAALLTTLRELGLTITADGDALIVQPRKLLTDELRAAIRANKPAILASERRRAKALALLEENPNLRRAVICEAGDPAIIGIAVCTVGYCELEVPAEKYDPVALMALLDQYAGTTQ
jgi:uncharacterized membrane protein